MADATRPGMRDGVIKRGSTYSYVVREKDHATGKTRPRWVGGFPTIRAAKEARDKARHDVHRGTWVPPQDTTVSAYLDRWIVAHAVELKPSTEKSYRDNIERYLKPAIGSERLQALSPTRLSVVFKDLHEHGGQGGKPLSPRTVEFARSVLRRAMQDAMLDRIIEVNPVVGTKRPRVHKPKHSTWTGAEAHTFLEHVAGARFEALWTLALATGMRRGELCALRWSDVDLEAGVIHVERSVTVQATTRIYSTPKNHERRDVTIDARTVAGLRAWRKTQTSERLAWGAAYDGSDPVAFTWENGTPVPPDYVSKAFIAAQAGAELGRLKLHEARHTHATILLRDGTPVHIVAKRLGHRDPSVTLNVYADAVPDDDGRAVDTFSRAVWGA
ncbi:site-specific integrase [Allobranchiibius sp. GilTou38]|uniref:tyrosine-type recombinase/integrase n=1 Tax=Allobranchiibius sp. GilTou38 TaxID=2815210 RepID=UPI001AA0CB08|nr:site-specific integrase [Allobranchiibius sp. GilTou38]MBO1767050.1 site-specific integrase [Allobranchiibius sp. GilTou38]